MRSLRSPTWASIRATAKGPPIRRPERSVTLTPGTRAISQALPLSLPSSQTPTAVNSPNTSAALASSAGSTRRGALTRAMTVGVSLLTVTSEDNAD